MFRFSTGVVQSLAQHQTIKEQFNDGVLNIYSGAQPATADAAINGVLLCALTLSGTTHVPGTKSTRQVDYATIGSSTENQTFIITVDGTAYTYIAGAGSSTVIVAKGLAALVDESLVVSAVADGSNVVLRARFGGVAYTAVSSGTGTIGAITNLIANARAAGIQFGTATAGVLAQESSAWQGTAGNDGTAAWFRICANPVDNTLVTTTLKRIDGSISTTSGDMILRTLNILTSDPISISGSTITFPTVRT